jgi:hypothetical protein
VRFLVSAKAWRSAFLKSNAPVVVWMACTCLVRQYLRRVSGLTSRKRAAGPVDSRAPKLSIDIILIVRSRTSLENGFFTRSFLTGENTSI